MKSYVKLRFVPLVLPLAGLIAPSPASAQITVTVEKPGVQSTQVKGATTVDFNAPQFQPGSFKKLETDIGTYTAPGKGAIVLSPIGGNAAYGGASTTGLPNPTQTQYVSIGSQSGSTEMDLVLNSAATYFGLYWAAGDALNKLTFYMGSVLVATYNVGDVISFLKGDSAYFGNPNNSADKKEPFAYLNFYATTKSEFDKIVFTNASTGTGFESDNHSVVFAKQKGDGSGDGGNGNDNGDGGGDGGDKGSGTGVVQTGTVVATIGTPEPATWVGALSSLAVAAFHLAKRRRTNLTPANSQSCIS